MGFFKKYPVFASLITVFVLLFVAGLVFIYLSFAGLGKAKKDFTRAESSYQSALRLSPAPTQQNVASSEQNVEQLASALQTQIDATKGRVPTFISKDVPKTEADMLFQLEAFKDQFTRDAAQIKPWGVDGDDATGIKLPEDFDFGFARFLSTGTPPPEKYIPVVFEQKEILAYVLRKLYDSEPVSIESIQRETKVVEIAAKQDEQSNTSSRRSSRSNQRDAGNSGFKDEFEIGGISARVPDAVETVAFRLVFTGYTPSLRSFLKSLEEFELPLVVRSVEVQPFQQKQQKSSSSNRADNPFSLFDTGSASTGAEETKSEYSPIPVVEENLSQFTVVVEYIKVLVKAPTDVAALEDAASSQNPM